MRSASASFCSNPISALVLRRRKSRRRKLQRTGYEVVAAEHDQGCGAGSRSRPPILSTGLPARSANQSAAPMTPSAASSLERERPSPVAKYTRTLAQTTVEQGGVEADARPIDSARPAWRSRDYEGEVHQPRRGQLRMAIFTGGGCPGGRRSPARAPSPGSARSGPRRGDQRLAAGLHHVGRGEGAAGQASPPAAPRSGEAERGGRVSIRVSRSQSSSEENLRPVVGVQLAEEQDVPAPRRAGAEIPSGGPRQPGHAAAPGGRQMTQQRSGSTDTPRIAGAISVMTAHAGVGEEVEARHHADSSAAAPAASCSRPPRNHRPRQRQHRGSSTAPRTAPCR